MISDLTGATGRAITDAILDGERDPVRLAALVHRGIKASRATMIKALQGDWRPEHLFTLRQACQTYRHYQQLISECGQEIEAAIRALEASQETPAGGADTTPADDASPQPSQAPDQPFNLRVYLTQMFGTDLTLIPGIGESTALTLFAELGLALSRFPSAAQFASWLNVYPHNNITGGKITSSRVGPGTNRAAQALRWATQALYRSPSALGEYFRRKRARLGTPEAVTATAHKLARIIYHIITHHVAYDDSLLDNQQRQHRKRLERRLRDQARALGFELTPQAV